jgi:putative SOS response-associated peptidase YedK
MRANALLQPQSDRMPVILHVKDYDRWLDLDKMERHTSQNGCEQTAVRRAGSTGVSLRSTPATRNLFPRLGG